MFKKKQKLNKSNLKKNVKKKITINLLLYGTLDMTRKPNWERS